ncbi:MAG: hypothetical protein AVDCRST_MAG65-524, partial [uncultured Solirubrobacteraceae bacterium]
VDRRGLHRHRRARGRGLGLRDGPAVDARVGDHRARRLGRRRRPAAGGLPDAADARAARRPLQGGLDAGRGAGPVLRTLGGARPRALDGDHRGHAQRARRRHALPLLQHLPGAVRAPGSGRLARDGGRHPGAGGGRLARAPQAEAGEPHRRGAGV